MIYFSEANFVKYFPNKQIILEIFSNSFKKPLINNTLNPKIKFKS